MPNLSAAAGMLPLYLYLDKPRAAWRWSALPADGIGLLRLEHLLRDEIGIHPMALICFERVTDCEARRVILEQTEAYACKDELFVDVVARHLARIGLQYAPRRIFVRFSDFTSAEYAGLVGGSCFEPAERWPELGLRGAARYVSERYRPAFELECSALYRAREVFGASNLSALIPFCRTPEEAEQVLALMARAGLRRGRDDFRVHVMAEIPSNILMAGEFAALFDGFTVGTGDLAQLIWGVDASLGELGGIDPCGVAVRRAIDELVRTAHAARTPVMVAGPLVATPGFLEFLVSAGVDALTVRPEDFGRVRERMQAHHEQAPGVLRPAEPLRPEPEPSGADGSLEPLSADSSV